MALTKEAAKAITADLDRLAQLFEADHVALGVPSTVATDFAYRCDLLSDFVEKRGGLDRTDSIQKEFDNEIETSHQPEEDYMATKTYQDELYELGQMVESGDLGKAALENIATKVADLLKAAGDEDEAEAEEEEAEEEGSEEDEAADKKAHLINLANNLLRLAGDDDDAEEDDEDEADEDEDEDEDEGKKAFAHGYGV